MKKNIKTILFAIIFFPISFTCEASVLSDAANSLSAGQSIRINTIGLVEASNPPEGSNIIQWGNTGSWDPIQNKVVWIGKRDGPNCYRILEYIEITNTWSNRTINHTDFESCQQFGHGYDGNAVDPATGDIYFRPNNSKVYHWSVAKESWLNLDHNGSGGTSDAIEWWPGRGVILSDLWGWIFMM